MLLAMILFLIAAIAGSREKINNYAYVNDFSAGVDQAYLTNINFSPSTPVPAPLPILGIPAVLLYSRNLKKRIKARREASSAALVWLRFDCLGITAPQEPVEFQEFP